MHKKGHSFMFWNGQVRNVQIPWGKKWVGGDWVYQHVRFQHAPCPPNWWRWVVSITLFKITSKRARSIFFTNFITSHNSSKIQSGNFENQKEKPHPVILCHVLNWKHTLGVYETVFSKYLLPSGCIFMSKPFPLPLATWFFLYNPNLNWLHIQ